MSENPVVEPDVRIRPSTGVVLPTTPAPIDGVVEPTFWEGLDVVSQGSTADTLPEVPQSEATYQWQREQQEEQA